MSEMAVVNAQLSELIRSLRKKGWTISSISKHLAMTGIRPSLRTIRRHCRRVVAEKKGRQPRKVTIQVMEMIDSILRTDNELPARKVKALLQRRHNIRICLNSVRKAIHNLGWYFEESRFVMTREKNRELRLIEADLTAEQAQVAQLLAENAQLKADLSADRAEANVLRHEIQRLRKNSQRGLLMQEMRAEIGELRSAQRMRPIPRRASAPAPELDSSMETLGPPLNDSSPIPNQWADVSLRDFGPEDHARLHQESYGQVGRYGCLLFRHIISEENYQAWSKTTNWDGSRNKRALPQNVTSFVVATLKRHFPGMDRSGLKDCIYKINEFLRTTRKKPRATYVLQNNVAERIKEEDL
ncbi:uncharacterized protein LOC134078204 [Sardina pilchardus]|uniref:uncharacterized protein LOC134078204 n=1 Tax=Sardina pilchardus TaxID=27697 RepID=UPI002E130524